MGINNVWVFAQGTERRTDHRHARTAHQGPLARRHRRRRSSPATAQRSPAHSASTAPRRCTATGDLAGALPGVAVAAAMQAVIDGGDSPDLIMFPQNYEGRDVMAACRSSSTARC